MNGFDSMDYLKYRRLLSEKLFQEQNRRESRTVRLADGYTVLSECFDGEFDGFPVYTSMSRLTDCRGITLCHWQNSDRSGEFFYLFRHANGHRYLLFREDLYGYSVLNLDTLVLHHEIPLQSVLKGEDFQESFIWTEPQYDPKNSLLAVSGCIWAYPYSVILLDFSEPMAEHPSNQWVDLHGLLDPEYQKYNGIDLCGFDHEGNLHLDAEPCDCEDKVHLCIPADECRRLLGIT